MFKLYCSQQCRDLETKALQDFGLTSEILMERAGERAFVVLQKQWPKVKRLAVVCGHGNNGGDGFVVARLAALAGFHVSVFTNAALDSLKGAAQNAFAQMQKANLKVQNLSELNFENSDVIVDALFGTGLTRDIAEPFFSVIQTINSSGKPILAIDVPSGLSVDTGAVLGIAVAADLTVTFIARKPGFYTADGPDHCGEICVEGLEIPNAVFENVTPIAEIYLLDALLKKWPPRQLNSHKGSFGHALIIGGEAGMVGAVRLSGEAALRVGAGLVTIATHPSHVAFANLTRPELICHGINKDSELRDHLSKATVLAIGPGLGQSAWARDLLTTVLPSDLPLVVDADALNLLAFIPQKKSNWILTPHPKEAARLLQCSVQDVQRNRFAAARELQNRFGGVILLKGHGTLICSDATSPIQICPYGTPAMASPGMGDTLTGIIVGLLAQGLSLNAAAHLGACLHGRAGEMASEDKGVVLASDLGPILARLTKR